MTEFATVRPEPERDRWGRPYVLTPGGRRTAYTRCTTYVGAIEDSFNITRWKERHVAVGIATQQHLRDTVASLSLDNDDHKTPLNDLCEQAKEAAGASDASRWGTYMHNVTEAHDRDLDPAAVSVPDLVRPRPRDAYVPDLAAYIEATKPLKHVQIEQFTVQDFLAIGGTPDRVVQVGRKRYIADLKTGDVQFGSLKIAAQLAVYARSLPYDVTTDQRMDAHGAEIDKGIVIHLPAGTGKCTLHWVDLLAGWEAVKVCRTIRAQRSKRMRDLFSPWDEPIPSEPVQDGEVLIDLATAVANATNPEAVRDVWRAHKDQWNDDLTSLAQARIAALA